MALALYDAFISYSHAKDKPIAAALQSVVQRLGKPWYRRRALRVFRDDTSLSATPHLWPSIEQALGQSRFLILLASPEAAASPWVAKEVVYWFEHKSADTLLIALTDGALAWDNAADDFEWSATTPLPAVLKGRFASEPKWVDLTAYRAGAAPSDARFMELGADFAAAIRGIPKEDLLSEEVRQQRRALTLAWSAAGSLLILAALAGWQWRVASVQRDRAERTLTAATSIAESLTIEMAQEFRNRTGMPVDLTRKILDRAEHLLQQLTQAGEDTAYLRRSRAVVLLELAKTYLAQGDIDAALSAARQARGILQGLLAVVPGAVDWQRDLSVANDVIGEALAAIGQRDEALAAYRESLEIRERLAAADRASRQAQRDLVVSYNKVGGLLVTAARNEEALAIYRKSLDIAQRLAGDPDDAPSQRDLATGHERIAGVLLALGRQDEALESYRTSLATFEKLAGLDVGNAQAQRDVWVSSSKIGDVLIAVGKHEEALAAYRKGLAIAERLAASDPGNTQWQRDLSISFDKIGDVLSASKPEDALASYRKSFAIAEKLAATDPRNAQWQRDLSVGSNKIGDVLLALGKPADALAVYRSGMTIAERLVAIDGGNMEWQRDLSVSCNKVADALLADGQRDEALEFYRKGLAVRKKLAAADPANVRWQTDLVVNLFKLAQLGDDALARLKQALTILRRLDVEGRLPANQKSWIPAFEQAIEALQK